MQHFAISAAFWVAHASRVLVAASRRNELPEEVWALEIVLFPESALEESSRWRDANASTRRRVRYPGE
jgi:hypothetical protein